MRSLTCPCERVFEADIPDCVDLDATPGMLSDIMDGTFLSARCPDCGTLVKPDLPVRVTYLSRKVDIQVIPELDRWAFYRNTVPVPSGVDVVIGYRELVERMRAVTDGLSPLALEVLKYYLLARAQQDNPEAEVVIEYAAHEDNRLVFEIWGLKEGEAGVIRVPEALYEKTLSELSKKTKEDPFSKILTGPYKSVRILEAEPSED